tara:strand:+ start:36 stop:575 length:540 start_codon:yes stop_codon:yes gene_type:complete
MSEMPPPLIEAHLSFADVDQEGFAALIRDGFGKQLVPGYFEQAHPIAIYVALAQSPVQVEGGFGFPYEGVAVVEAIPGLPGVHYLDKLVTSQAKKRNGVGSGLFATLMAHHPKLVWRADPSNKDANDFYRARTTSPTTDAWARQHGWHVYHAPGVRLSDLFVARQYAINKPITLETLTD